MDRLPAKPKIESEEVVISYVDLEELQYDSDVLLFLRKKLDDFTIDCLRKVIEHRKTGGLNKTKIENYLDHRKRYDAAILTLEVQGFIECLPDGVSKPYFLTKRGNQLIHLLHKERENELNNNQNNLGGYK